MKTILKFTAIVILACTINTSFAQQKSDKEKQQTTKNKKNKAIDNKIAVSDQAQPGEKGKSTKKQSGISNK